MAEEPKDTSQPAEVPEEGTTNFLDRIAARNRQLYTGGMLKEVYAPSGKGFGYVPSNNGGGRRKEKEEAPERSPVTILLDELRADKSKKINESVSLSPDEAISKLVVKGHLQMFKEEERCVSTATSAMQDALAIHLGINISDGDRHVIYEDDLKKALKGIAADKFKFLAEQKTVQFSVVSALKEGNVNRLIELGMLKVEPSLSHSALFSVKAESVKTMEELGLDISRKDGKSLIKRDALHAKLAADPKAVDSLLISPVQLTAKDVIAGLVDRDLVCRISYASTDAGTPHELRVRSEAAVGALESVGVNVDSLPGGARIIQRKSLIKAFGNDEYAMNKAFSNATMYLRERQDEQAHRR